MGTGRPAFAPESGPACTLIVPGFRGSGPAHWQTWFEERVPGARRISGVDWNAPVLATWAGAIARQVGSCAQPPWLVAHSFGCLAAVTAVAQCPNPVAGLMLVAPADPERFGDQGYRDAGQGGESVAHRLPSQALGVSSLVVASRNDPWVRQDVARDWAGRWGSRFVDAGEAGHINVDSGFGPWPGGLQLFDAFRKAATADERAPAATFFARSVSNAPAQRRRIVEA